ENIDDDDDEDEGLKEGVNDLVNAFSNGLGRIKRNDVVEIGREPGFHLLHQLGRRIHGLNGIGAWKLINGDESRGFPIHPADDVVHLCAELNAGDVLEPDDGSVLIRTDHDVTELLFRLQTTLSTYTVSKLLPGRHRFSTYLASRIHRVLGLNGIRNFGHRDAELGKVIRPDPESHGILPGTEDLYLADAGHASHGNINVHVPIVRQKGGVVGAVR